MTAQKLADSALVRAVAAGDRAALGTLYDQYTPKLLSIAMTFLGERAEAEDIVHNVFLEVWQQAHSYDSARGSVRGWLVMRTRSRCLDRLKSSAVAKRSAWNARHDTRATATGTDQDADRARVHRLVGSLPKPQMEVVILSYFGGMSASEIGRLLDVPTGTVKSRIAASLRSLRDELAESTTMKMPESGVR